MSKLSGIQEEIQMLRTQLQSMVNTREDFSKDEVIRISKQMDVLINRYNDIKFNKVM